MPQAGDGPPPELDPVRVRVRWQETGAHVHVRLFVGRSAIPHPASLGLAGTLTFRAEEWDTIVAVLFSPAGIDPAELTLAVLHEEEPLP